MRNSSSTERLLDGSWHPPKVIYMGIPSVRALWHIFQGPELPQVTRSSLDRLHANGRTDDPFCGDISRLGSSIKDGFSLALWSRAEAKESLRSPDCFSAMVRTVWLKIHAVRPHWLRRREVGGDPERS